MKYILLTAVVMTLAVVIGIKLAIVLLVLGGIVVLIGIGAAASAAMTMSGKCTDERSPLAEVIWESDDDA